MAAKSKKKIILITIIASVLLAGLIILLVILLTSKKPTTELSDSPVIATTDATLDGEFALEEEKVDPTSASTVTTEAPTTETASTLPKTGATTDFFAFAIFAGALVSYLSSLRFKSGLAA